MKVVAVIGEGAWGTAVAALLADNGYRVKLWCHDPMIAQQINDTHVNERYMPGITVSSAIDASSDIAHVVDDVAIIFEAIPVKFLRTIMSKTPVRPDQLIVSLSKGIEQTTLLLPSQIIQETTGCARIAVVSGPSFAYDVVRKQPTGFMVAATRSSDARAVSVALSNEHIHIQETTDLIGMQLAGALKNVIALGIGILQGAGYADNTQALLLTRGIEEIGLVVRAVGGDSATVYSLAGVGDLVLTAFGGHSKNVHLGRLIGSGRSLADLAVSGTMPEGVNTVMAVQQLAVKYNVQLPVCRSIHDMVIHQAPVDVLVKALFS